MFWTHTQPQSFMNTNHRLFDLVITNLPINWFISFKLHTHTTTELEISCILSMGLVRDGFCCWGRHGLGCLFLFLSIIHHTAQPCDDDCAQTYLSRALASWKPTTVDMHAKVTATGGCDCWWLVETFSKSFATQRPLWWLWCAVVLCSMVTVFEKVEGQAKKEPPNQRRCVLPTGKAVVCCWKWHRQRKRKHCRA